MSPPLHSDSHVHPAPPAPTWGLLATSLPDLFLQSQGRTRMRDKDAAPSTGLDLLLGRPATVRASEHTDHVFSE